MKVLLRNKQKRRSKKRSGNIYEEGFLKERVKRYCRINREEVDHEEDYSVSILNDIWKSVNKIMDRLKVYQGEYQNLPRLRTMIPETDYRMIEASFGCSGLEPKSKIIILTKDCHLEDILADSAVRGYKPNNDCSVTIYNFEMRIDAFTEMTVKSMITSKFPN